MESWGWKDYHLVRTSTPWTVCVPVGSSSKITTRGSGASPAAPSPSLILPPPPAAPCARPHSAGREARRSPLGRLWGPSEAPPVDEGAGEAEAGGGRATRMPASFS